MEAERITHDHRRAIPADFDEMAACSPREAIRVAVPHDEAHEILEALNDPLEGEPRVEKTYSRGTPADQFELDAPGCTGVYTLEQVREMVEELGGDARGGESSPVRVRREAGFPNRTGTAPPNSRRIAARVEGRQ